MNKLEFVKKLSSCLLAAAVAATSVCVPTLAQEIKSDADTSLSERVVAFPGAEGGGMYASGGRGALDDGEKIEVYHVTNLNDSGEGSFRDAVSKGNRIIVFDVSGYIDLSSNVNIGRDNVTVLGQTAPGEGITFRSNNIKVGGNNIILRYLKFRVGAHDANGNDTRAQDGLEVTDNSTNVIIDHCSVSWGTDENLSAYAVKDVTIQNSIIAEALNQSVHDKGEHSYAAIWGGVNLSIHHNVIASHKSRNPKIGTSETVAMTAGYTDDQTLVDMKNNVIYNWGDKAGYGTENGAKTYIQNNIYKPGPATPSGKRARIFELSVGQKYQINMFGSVYASGNIIDVDSGDSDYASAQLVNENNWQDDKHIGVYTDTKFYASGDKTNIKITEPDSTYKEYEKNYPITLDKTEDVFEKVINNAGATLPKRDKVDERIIENVVNRTGVTGSKGSMGLLDDPIDGIPEGKESEYDDRGYPIIESVSRDSDYDTDGDGIPDTWEDKMGLDKNNKSDGTNIGPDGYTWLENYVEQAVTNVAPADISVTVSETQNFYYTSKDSILLKANVHGDVDKVEFYVKDTKVGETSEIVEGTASVTVTNVITGDNTLVAKAIKKDGSYVLSQVERICVIGADEITDWTVDGAASLDGDVYTLVSGSSMYKKVSGDFKLVTKIDEISNTKSDVYSGISCGDVAVAKSYDGTTQRISISTDDIVETLSMDATKYSLLEIAREGNSIKVYAGTSLADLENNLLKECTTSESELTVGSFVDGDYLTVSKLGMLRLVQSVTEPKVEFGEFDSIGLSGDSIEVKVTPDNSPVTEVWIYLNGTPIASKSVNIEKPETVSIPVEFTTPQRGTITAYCFDENLGKGSVSRSVAITQDPTPWELDVFGAVGDESVPYVEVTQDYTFKISGVGGTIGTGDSDKFTYLSQSINGDIRMYYRSRMQSSKQFGVVFTNDTNDKLSSVSRSLYFFGGVVGDDGKPKYQLIKRTKGGAAEVVADVTEKTGQGANLYFIAEKIGDTINIYQTENGSTIYTTKTLLSSVKCDDLGDNYRMGYASVTDTEQTNVPDAGWVGLENIMPSERENVYIKDYKDGVVTINKGEGFSGGKIVVCGYDEDGAVVDTLTADAIDESTSVGNIMGSSYKVFLWNNFEELMPLCTPYDGTQSVSEAAEAKGWNFDNGLDWMWQIQERNVLTPSWTKNVGQNTSGMMAIEPSADYSSDRYIFHEYLMDDKYMPQMECDVLLSGDEPGFNVYFQVGKSDKAYKVTFSEDGSIYTNGKTKVGEWDSSDGWYNVNIKTDMNESAETVANLTVKKSDGSLVVDNKAIEISTGSEFRTQINTAKKTAVTKAVYFEPLSSASGKYYVDNVKVTANIPSVNVEKVTSWYTFDKITAINGAFTVDGTTTPGGSEKTGETASVAAGAELKTGGKTADGVSFTNRIRVNKGNKGTITIPVTNGSLVTVYAASANSSKERPLIINGNSTNILAACSTSYTYEGEAGTIDISAGDNIEVYGIKVESVK